MSDSLNERKFQIPKAERTVKNLTTEYKPDEKILEVNFDVDMRVAKLVAQESDKAVIEHLKPQQLNANPHVKELVEALKIIAKREYPLADKVLKKWSKEMPEWLEDEKRKFTYEFLEEKYPISSYGLVDDCFQKCFELMSQETQWKPIDTAPKEDEFEILPGNLQICYSKQSNRYWIMCNFNGYANPTHWMKLPDEPEGGK